MVLSGMKVKPGEAWEHCPREAFKRVFKILKDEFDLLISDLVISVNYLPNIIRCLLK